MALKWSWILCRCRNILLQIICFIDIQFIILTLPVIIFEFLICIWWQKDSGNALLVDSCMCLILTWNVKKYTLGVKIQSHTEHLHEYAPQRLIGPHTLIADIPFLLLIMCRHGWRWTQIWADAWTCPSKINWSTYTYIIDAAQIWADAWTCPSKINWSTYINCWSADMSGRMNMPLKD